MKYLPIGLIFLSGFLVATVIATHSPLRGGGSDVWMLVIALFLVVLGTVVLVGCAP